MEPLKISELSGITSPNTSTSIIPVVSSGETYNMTLDSLSNTIVDNKVHLFVSGQTFNGDITVNGNVVVNGKVISFTLLDITYDALVFLINYNFLQPGVFYRIIDYNTVYWMLDDNGVEINNGVPITGVTEPIVVFATSTNTLGINATSPFFHNDLIEYNWDPIDFVNDAAFSNLSNFGFKGVITYREDTLTNISTDWDFRNIKYRRWEPTAPEWQDTPFYVVHDVVLHDLVIYKCIADNINREPSLNSSDGYWVQILNLNDNPYWNPNSTNITFDGVTISSSLNYRDFYTFNLLSVVKDNNIRTSLCNFGSVLSRLSNIVFIGDSDGVKIRDSNVRVLTIGNGAKDFDFKSNVREIIIGTDCSNITINSGGYNLILSDNVDNAFFDNNCNNSIIGSNCLNIKMGTDSNNIVVGSQSDSLNFGSRSYMINTGTFNYDISFDSGCNNITTRDTCSIISLGVDCKYISISPITKMLKFEPFCKYLELPQNSLNTYFNMGCSNGDFTHSTWIIRLLSKWVVTNEDYILKLTYFSGEPDNIYKCVNINE